MPKTETVRVAFDRGTLVVRGDDSEVEEVLRRIPDAARDGRVGAVRLPALRYHDLIRDWVGRKVDYTDEARSYEALELPEDVTFTPRPYQLEAITAWRAAGRRGVVVLPTGTGKTLVAVLAIRNAKRSALVVVPTIDLLHQWFDLLATQFGEGRVGCVGGGEHRVEDLTVITYDSAYLHLDRLGNRFGLVIFDEVHHLPGPAVQQAARMTLAPFRLGLTATPPDEVERVHILEEVVGRQVYAQDIRELAGDYLSTYETVTIRTRLSAAEQTAYDEARKVYRGFIAKNNIWMGGPDGWGRFLEATNRSPEGRQALAAWREQRRIALATPQKLEHLQRLLRIHKGERMLVFTNGNQEAYEVSRRFLVPVITHQTKARERKAILDGLRAGELPIVVTSRVLNEGVDVPSVSVGVVLSGTGTVREHVQRLGRILRKAEGKHAMLYEIVSEGTAEEGVSDRRREHDAYR